MQRNDADRQVADHLEEFFDVTFQMSEKELQAIHGMIPMTQELFEQCVRKCENLGAYRQLEELIREFPKLYHVYCENEDEGSEDASVEISSESTCAKEDFEREPYSDIVWQRIHAQLEKMQRS